MALSSDGNTALIGGHARQRPSVGAAWVFTRSGSTWTQQGEKLTGGGETGAGEFGASVALSSDGNTALIGGPDDTGVGRGVGVHALGRRPGPSRAKSSPAAARAAKATLAQAWRCPPTATPR